MTHIDAIAIRRRADRLAALADQAGTGLRSGAYVTAVALAANLSAADVPDLVGEVGELRAELAEANAEVRSVTNQLTHTVNDLAQVRNQAHRDATEHQQILRANTELANENARLRSKLADIEDVGRCDHDAGLDVECRPCLVETYGQREAGVAR